MQNKVKRNLQEEYPEIASEWDYEKNDKTPSTVSSHSDIDAWWRCKENHSYRARIDHRTRERSGCPYCAGKLPIKGENDFETKYPELAKEWDYANNEKSPSDYLPFSNKSVSWICPICGQSYKRTVNERTSKGFACPDCTKESHTSKQEQTIFYYLSKIIPVENRKIIHGKELDVYIPDYNTGIEYNGEYFHSQKESKDALKYEFLRNKGIRVIVIQCGRSREQTDDTITLKTIEKSNPTDDEFFWGLIKMFEIIGLPTPDIDLKRDEAEIYNLYVRSIKENSIAVKYPEIASEWCYEKNKNLKPESFGYASNKRVWWTCKKCGNDYDMVVANRTVGNNGCPYCSGKRIKVGFNDLATTYPNLITEWDYNKNEKGPEKYSKGSDEKVWWICDKGHEWEATISSRASGQVGCPVCAGRKAYKGYNDLFTVKPELKNIWNYDKNTIDPEERTAGSNEKVWWKCDQCGHEWEAKISMISKGERCPLCAKKNRNIKFKETLKKSRGSLAEKFPELLEEWDYERNKITPEDCISGSSNKVWWICKTCGYSWETTPYQRTTMHQGCPKCGQNRSVQTRMNHSIVEKGSLADNYPELIKEWDYDKNEKRPEEYTSGSKEKVWWKCSKGHSWQAVIGSRTHSKAGCPKCAGRLKVKNIDTGEIFDNCTLAAKSVGVTRKAVELAIKNKTKCKGYSWEKVE